MYHHAPENLSAQFLRAIIYKQMVEIECYLADWLFYLAKALLFISSYDDVNDRVLDVVGVDGVLGVAVGGFGNPDKGFIFIVDDFKPYL